MKNGWTQELVGVWAYAECWHLKAVWEKKLRPFARIPPATLAREASHPKKFLREHFFECQFCAAGCLPHREQSAKGGQGVCSDIPWNPTEKVLNHLA
jgi:hypothetical protein